MYNEIAKLVLYHDLGEDSIIYRLADIYRAYENHSGEPAYLISRIYQEIKRLLDLATQYGFDENLWHNYLAYLLITNENSFSLTCEKKGASDGTVNTFAKKDFKIFKSLFEFDFSAIENDLGIDCFSTIQNYRSIPKKEQIYNREVSKKVKSVSRRIEKAKDEDEIFTIITDFYQAYGVGMFGLNKAFRITGTKERLAFEPINNTDSVSLNDLVGYESQKKKLIDNTEAFVRCKKANNVLLFGDSGTGKSTSIKAIMNAYYDQGLRMIEIYKHQFQDLSGVISQIKKRNYRFIIYMDDLSFEDFEIEYKYLKAVIEGGLESRPDNVLIYATSNRRHLIRESWNDKNDMEHDGEIHRSDTIQEKLSLAQRFGVSIFYAKPQQEEYYNIVRFLAAKHPEIMLSDTELCAKASQWELSHGGISGRTAQQFVDYLAGQFQ